MENDDDKNISQAVNDFNSEKIRFNKALEIAKGDQKLAKDILSGKINDICIVKGKFINKKINNYVVFYLIINKRKINVEKSLVLVSNDYNVYNISFNSSWIQFITEIYKFFKEFNIDLSKSSSLNASLGSCFSASNLPIIINAIEDKNISALTMEFNSIFDHMLNFKEIELIVDGEEINEIDYYTNLETIESKFSAAKDEVEKDNGFDNILDEIDTGKSSIIYHKADVKLSPTSGYPVYTFRPGDKIFVLLDSSDAESKNILEKANAIDKEEGKISPIQGVIKNISIDHKITIFSIEINPIFHVKCEIEGSVRLQAPNAPINVSDEEEEKEKTGKLKFILSMVSIFVIIIVIIILFILGVF